MVKVGMLSKWHVHAVDYAKHIQNSDIAQITAVWDDDETRGKEWADSLGCTFYSKLEDILSDSNVDAVICDAPTTQHYEILKKAAAAGKHIFTEKVLAPSTAQCKELAKCFDDAGIKFAISFPHRTTPVELLAKQMINDGKFGTISLVRIRKAHDGVSGNWLPKYWFEEKDAAGGALMDLGCHPMYLSTWLLGNPIRIASLITAPLGSKVDDAATASIEFENGAVCTAETSFISYRAPDSIEIYGTDATLLSIGGNLQLYTKEHPGSPITPELPECKPLPIMQFLQACHDNTSVPEDFSAQEAIKLTHLLENAYISDRENRIVSLA